MKTEAVAALERDWRDNPRWSGIRRPYAPDRVLRLRGNVAIEHTLARRGAERLWDLLHTRPFVRTLGAFTGNQAVQQVQAGLEVVYVSGWQVAADGNTAGQMYPDLSLYPADSVPAVIRRVNNALRRADQVNHLDGNDDIDWMAPVVADAESGFGGNLNAFELTRAMIDAGVAGLHFEDQLASAKKCGHLGGKVLVPVREAIQRLVAARLAADVEGVPTVIIGRTDAESSHLVTSDVDDVDRRFLTGTRTVEGYHGVKAGVEFAIERARAYAPYSDLVWCETGRPDLGEAREIAAGIHEAFPGKPIAYNCSPSFHWKKHLDDAGMMRFQEALAGMGYVFQMVTLAGFHVLNASMFELARGYRTDGMRAFAKVQENELAMERTDGFAAVRHQRFVGAAWFDEVQMAVTEGQSSTGALSGSTEEAQFQPPPPKG